MSETPNQNASTSPGLCSARYSKVSENYPAPDDLQRRTDSPPSGEENSGSYVRAYRTASKSIAINYNAAEIQARSVRREISKILEG